MKKRERRKVCEKMTNIYDEIEKVASELYLQRGAANGRSLDNWLEAERMVEACYMNHQGGAKDRRVAQGRMRQQNTGKARAKA